MRRVLVAAILSLLTASCSKAVENFVRGAHPVVPPAAAIPQVGGANTSRDGIKISPGAMSMPGSRYGAEMTITPSMQALPGSTIGARVGIQQDNSIR